MKVRVYKNTHDLRTNDVVMAVSEEEEETAATVCSNLTTVSYNSRPPTAREFASNRWIAKNKETKRKRGTTTFDCHWHTSSRKKEKRNLPLEPIAIFFFWFLDLPSELFLFFFRWDRPCLFCVLRWLISECTRKNPKQKEKNKVSNWTVGRYI